MGIREGLMSVLIRFGKLSYFFIALSTSGTACYWNWTEVRLLWRTRCIKADKGSSLFLHERSKAADRGIPRIDAGHTDSSGIFEKPARIESGRRFWGRRWDQSSKDNPFVPRTCRFLLILVIAKNSCYRHIRTKGGFLFEEKRAA